MICGPNADINLDVFLGLLLAEATHEKFIFPAAAFPRRRGQAASLLLALRRILRLIEFACVPGLKY
jgi:hypothetical protein